jgi:Sugar kinases, ribokinase family
MHDRAEAGRGRPVFARLWRRHAQHGRLSGPAWRADYITALGDDTLSDEMVAGWAAEGVGTSRVSRLPGKLPGLYMIQTDDEASAGSFTGARVRPRAA